ncbi:hypothetical protein AGDE_16290 [Angomonas deanei]|uniref:Uncharacterized protein n=1 Tax=Angomonas deanei TaxID=59799 RepID=A0A7G2C3F7_9TRYP|nr:hypothetical protein AGDE_16290 [Angomonas deanei]CAD2213794.1 hypothetical protein, conserved [Angomonas deanei]|eukprot:EPY17374.1 hypothetical protein AGDE_16290 [Angomonas deanei]
MAVSKSAPRTQKQKREEERMQDRKAFLRAVLNDEIQARQEAEAMREELEQELGIMGPRHHQEYEQTRQSGARQTESFQGSRINQRGVDEVPTVGEQYEEILDELRYVSGRPVGFEGKHHPFALLG